MSDKLCVIITLPDCRGAVALPAKNEELTLKHLQDLVGGYIEVVPTLIPSHWIRKSAGDGIVMIVDEEGKLKGKRRNVVASDVARIRDDDYIAGAVILLAKRGEELVGIPWDDANEIIKRWFEPGGTKDGKSQ